MKNAKISAAKATGPLINHRAKPAGIRRKRWLGSGSVLAAAIAMTATFCAPAAAQSSPAMPSRISMEPGTGDMVRGVPREIEAPVPTHTRSLPAQIATQRIVAEQGIYLDAPAAPQPSRSRVSPAQPIVNTISIGPAPAPSQTTASSTPATLPGDTDVTGVNVLADANYFSTDIDFRPGAAEDVVEVLASQAIINWQTLTSGSAGNTVDFLPAGGTLRFNSTLGDYTVLNRVFTPGIDSAIRIDGNVSSTVFGGSVQGGNVWFYSPGGIVVGQTARFNVGSLILTSSEIEGISSTVGFLGVAEPDTSVIIENGAVINADSSVVMVAPRIEQGGTVRSQGNIAYIGAEQAEVSFAGGLFGISVTVGTDDPNGIVHTGTTGGPTLGEVPLRAITMDTVSKTGAVTMLLGGNIGYDDAFAATESNGTIILTAADGAAAGSGNIEIGAAQFNSDTVLRTTGDLSLSVDGQGSEIIVGSATQQADFIALSSGDISVSATSGGNIAVSGNFTAVASDGETGGTINVTVDDAGRNDDTSFSGLIVSGGIDLDVSAVGIDDTNLGGIGGDAVAGTININASQGGEIVAGLDFALIANAQAGYGLAQAGSATGGTVNVNIDGQNTRVSANGFLVVTADGNAAFDPVDRAEPLAPEIGNVSAGGIINFNLNGGLLSGLGLSINANAFGSSGGSVIGAGSYDGTGGSVVINNNANLDFGTLDINADGQGGNGGTGGSLEAGSVGGVGTGGSISITSSVDLGSLTSLTLNARGTGGGGGEGGFSAAGGTGGAGIGGNIGLSVSGTGAVLNNLVGGRIDSGAQGGAGGAGGSEETLISSGDGGTGGSATGGASAFTLGGAGSSYTLNSDALVLVSDAVGGAGGNGGLNLSGLSAGDGGAGGDATGGTVSAEVLSGATLSLAGISGPFAFSALGTGGGGGTGGGVDMAAGGAAGNGGDGGSGTGGSPQLTATGGTIDGANGVLLTATGAGGTGGTGGDDGISIIGAQGNGGAGAGGAPTIQIFDGSPGVITLGNVTIDAAAIGGGGTITGAAAGGQITITDASVDPAGLITMGTLTVDASGSVGTSSGLLSISTGSGPITLTGGLNADVAGDIDIALDGTGQLVVGGAAFLTASGNIDITHTNNAGGAASLISTGLINAAAQGSIDAQAGSRIVSFDTVTLRAEGNASVDDVTGAVFVNISAAGNVDVNNASVTGAPITIPFGDGTLVAGPQLLIEAGLDSPVSGSYDPNFDATISGLVTSTGTIVINAGGNAVFAAGSNAISDNGLTVTTGDDIIIAQGASIISGANPATAPNINPFADFNNLVLNAGGITPLLSAPLTPIASIVSDGTINANGFAVVMSANAIDALGGSIIASSAAIDINDAPSDAVIAAIGQSDDNGLLSVNCLQGNICIGNIQADNQLLIGQSSNNDAVALFIEQGTVNANDILVTTRNDIVMGTNGIATTLNASNSFSAVSLSGDVNLFDASITSDQIIIEAAISLIGTGVLTSTNDIGITVGQDLIAGSIITGGQLTGAADVGGDLEVSFSVPGSADIGLLSVGTGDVNIIAGDTVRIGAASVPGTNISLSGGTLAQLDFTTTAANVTLDGGAVVFGQIAATGDVTAVSSSSVDFTAIDAGAGINLTAVTAATGGDLTAGATVQVDAASIALGVVDANAIVLSSASDIFFNALISPSAITLDAASGTIGANTGPGDIASGGAVSLNAQAITVGNIDAAGSVDAATTAGSLAVGDVTSTALGSGITLSAAGAVSDIAAGTLTTNSGDILLSSARDISLVAAQTSAGTPAAASIGMLAGRDVSVTGALTAGEDIVIRSLGTAALNTLTAGDDIVVDADGSVTLASATTTGTGIDLFSLAFDEASAGQSGAILFAGETLTGSGITLSSGVDVTVSGTLNANDAISVLATGTPSIGNAVSGGNTTITGASVALDNGTIGGNLALIASTGNIDGNGLVSVAGGIALEAAGGIGFGSLIARNGDFTAVTDGDIIFDTIGSSQLVDLQAGGLIQGNRIDAVDAITMAADSSIFIDHAEAGTDFIAVAGGSITTGLNSIITGGDIIIAGDIVDLGNSSAGGLIDVIGTQIDFVNLIAGTTVTLVTDFNTPRGVTGSGNLNITGTNITAGVGASSLDALGSISVSGALNILGSLTMSAFGDIGFGSGLVEGGDFIAAAGGAITLTTAEASGQIDFLSGTDLTATGAITGSNGVFLESSDGGVSGTDIFTGGDIGIAAASTVTFNDLLLDLGRVDIVAGSDVTLNNVLAASDISITTAGALDAGEIAAAQGGTGDVQVQADAGIQIATLRGVTATLQAANGAVAVTGDAALTGLLDASGQSVFVRSSGDLIAAADATAGNVDIAAGGDLATQGISANGDVILQSAGAIANNAATTSSGGDITITAGTNILINSLVEAAGTLAIAAGDLIDIRALASGAGIDTLSGDINIDAAGALGRSDLTSSIVIATQGDIQLGGTAGTSTGFELDNDEFSRIHSGGDLAIAALGLTTGEGNMNVGDLTVLVGSGTGAQADGNISDFGALFLEAGNDVNITGNLVVTGATPDNLLAIDAFNSITIDAGTATVRVEDGNGAISGSIGMTADTIIAANAENLAQLPGLSFADAEVLLGQAAGSPRDDGYILGSSITFNVGSSVLIENSGAGSDFGDRRGIVADTLLINSVNPDVGIVVNGVIDTATGLDALPLIDTPIDFDPLSTVNGCLIADPASCGVITTPVDSGPIDGPIRDLIDDQVEEESPVVDAVASVIVELREDPEQQQDPLLDEPVTGAGNEDFWFAGEGEDESEEELEPAE